MATLLLFPTSITLYGVFAMIFAAKEAVEKRARNRGRQEGIEEGRKAERKRISRVLADLGVALTPEQARAVAGEPDKE